MTQKGCVLAENVLISGMKLPEIYAVCVARKERYIGKTARRREKRLQEHLAAAKRGEKTRLAKLLRAALRDEKEISIVWVDTVRNLEEWGALEAAYIQFYRESGFDLVNTTLGGNGTGSGENHPFFGGKQTKEARDKMSRARRGKPHSKDHCQAISQSLLGEKHPAFGKKQTREQIEKRSLKMRGENNPNFGKPMSEKQKQQISDALIGRFGGEKNPMFGKSHTLESLHRMSEFQKENQRHVGLRKSNTSGYVGVSRHGNRWSAMLLRKRLGNFDTREEAAQVRDMFARELWGNDCYLNFP